MNNSSRVCEPAAVHSVRRAVCCLHHGRIDFAEAAQHSHWNGFDLTTKAETKKRKRDLFEKRPQVAWRTPPCTTKCTHQSQSRSKFYRTQVNVLNEFLWLVEQECCETILVRMRGSTSLGRDGAFPELKERFRGGSAPGCQ